VAGPFDDLIPGNQTAPSTGPIYGPPLHPTPQTPDQAQGQALNNQRTAQEIATQPLQNANTQANIQQSQASVHNQTFNQNQGLRQEFNALPEVKNYSVALSSLGTALKAPDTPQGDLAIIYAYAKAADPGSVVREGEMDMATATASLPQQFQADAQKLTQGKRLPPAVRTGLIETMRQAVLGMRQTYDQQRNRYATLAQQNGFDPQQIVGQPLYDAIRPLEENYIRQHGGTPRDPNAPQDQPQEGDIGFNRPNQPKNPFTPEQQNAYDAFLKANPNATPDQLNSFIHSIGLQGTIGNAGDVTKALQQTGQFSPASTAIEKPNITDVRGGNNSSAQDAINAAVRGVGDTVSMGALDKAVALGDTVVKGGTFDQNLARQYAISDYDQQNHPLARIGGEALGGAVLPMGEVDSIGNLAGKGAAYGGAYGLGSSRSVSDIPANVIGGAAVGAAVPTVLGKVFRPKATGVDPLVDPVTGELNQPMVNSMTPAQRTAVMQAYGLKTMTPGMVGGRTARVLEQGLNNVPGSAGVMEDVNAQASGELRRSMQGVAQQFGSSKTLAEGGAELQRGANQYIDRSQAVTSKAYNAIPIADQAQASTSNTVATLRDLTSRFQSNPDLAAAFQDKNLARYQAALEKGPLSWRDLKDFRSLVGEKIGEMRFGEGSSTSDLRALYAGLSQDMQDTAAAQGPRAVAAFNRANSLYRQQQQLIEGSLTRILGPDGNLSPERAAAAVQAMTRGGKATGDLRTLAQIRAATVKSGAWDEIASTLIHLGGQPANSEGRAFNPQTFIQWYADMSEPARQMLFKPELRKSLDGFVAMNQQLARIKGLSNTSNTTPTMIGSGAIAAGGIAAISHPMALLGLVAAGGANYGMAKLWTNPGFVRLVTGLGRAGASGSQHAIQSQVGRLAKFAAANPEFSEPVQAILRQVSNDNFVGPLAASPNADQKQQQQ
jgi:hypothetical protein